MRTLCGNRWLLPRVEISSAFVFWKLRRILYFRQNRVEIYLAIPKPSSALGGLWASAIGMMGFCDQR